MPQLKAELQDFFKAQDRVKCHTQQRRDRDKIITPNKDVIRQEEEVKVSHDKGQMQSQRVDKTAVKDAHKEEPFDFDEMIAFERLSNFSSQTPSK